MEFRVLGPLEVRVDGGPLPLGGEKQRALLALLVLNANRVVSRERLIDELWGDDPPETAVQTVQVYVSRLRKLFPAGTLLTRRRATCWRPSPEAIDLQRFERLVADARGADAERASRLLREALALWRGPALGEFGEEPFAQAEAGRLEDLRLAALEERIEADLSLGRHADLVGELETLVAANPHRERLRGQLMLALYRAGRQAEALEAYRDARAALDELGIEPSSALRGLEKAILVQDAALDVPLLLLKVAQPLAGAARAGAVVSVRRPRRANWPRSARCSSAPRAARAAWCFSRGEPGAGKTRLVRELARDAAAAGVLVCYGASDAAVTVPYQPLREWLDFLLGVCDPATLAECVGDGGELVARIAPAFATLAGKEAPPPGVDATVDRYLLQTAVGDFVRRLSRLRPLFLVVEDIHWSDSETLLLLARLARMAPESRMLVIATLRSPGAEIPREHADTLTDLSRLEGVTRLALGNLTDDDVDAFVRDSTDAEASAELVAAIGELSNGTPLLLCELWRELLASGAVEISNAHASLARPVAELRGSHRIDELVEQRLSRLSPGTAAMIELAAAIGPRFELRLLAAAAELDRSSLVASVDEAVAIGMLDELPEAQPACRFTHELVRRAIYDRIRRVRRPELHLQVANALERTYADDLTDVVPELAHHFTVAAPVAGAERAIEYNLRAAAAATGTFAYDEAAARLSTALELGLTDPRERAGVQLELGNLLWLTGRVGEAEAILTASLDAAANLEERGLAARALVHLSMERMSSDPGVGSAEIVLIAEEAIRTLEQLPDSPGLAEAESLLGNALGRAGRTEESFAALDRALAHADAAGNQVLRREVIAAIAMTLCDGSTPAEEAIDRIDELRSSSRNDPVLDAGLRRCLALLLAMAGRFDEAREHILVSSAVLDTADQTQLSVKTRWHVADAKALIGDRIGAEQELIGQFVSMRDARGEGSEARALRASAHLALLCCDRGDWDKAAEYLSYGHQVDRSAPVEGKTYAVLRLAARGRLAAARGDLAEGLELAQLAVEVAERGAG